MRLLLDTNRYTDLVVRDHATTERLQTADDAWVSVITLGELHAGFAAGTRSAQNLARLESFLTARGVGVLPVDDKTAVIYGEVHAQLRRAGTPIPTNDIWIAALAIQHNLVLDTRDEHFKKVAGLQLA